MNTLSSLFLYTVLMNQGDMLSIYLLKSNYDSILGPMSAKKKKKK